MKKLLFLFILFSFVIASAQNSFVIKDVKLFDGEKVIERTSVKVDNGTIVEVAINIHTSGKDQIIDGNGKTLIPALSNAHVHAWAPQSLSQAAKAGVLNVMDMHGVETYQSMMRQLKDSTNYARYFVAGYAATAPEGHGTQFGFPVPTLNKPEDAKKFITDRVEANVDYIKIIVEPWRNTLSSETVAALIKEAHLADRMAVVHVSRLADAINVLSHDADGIVHIWWDKEIKKDQLDKLLEKKTFFVIPTLLTTIKAFDAMNLDEAKLLTKEKLFAQVKKLFDNGVPILAGTDPPNVGINFGTDLYQELQLLNESGMSTIEVLKAGTSNVADAFGLEDRGYVIAGYRADLILLDGDVTNDIKQMNQIITVWKDGKVVKR
ncbi:MAG: amidohydrolase family protein [Winogradskyella sp.]|uniref:amidohydrolase family protein n=1 Tax=Winogradskyella sp. TaxID=1883156 RepID=UPI0025DA84B7|nr:amidohydrolase family protein [Winogradskyella sp.]NRB83017.1 amidohydrolase family protein [Winogradskyella sp.]